MYLRKLHIHNLKLLRDLPLSFTRADGTPRMWTVIVGENGLCKTSILRAIGLAAAGVDRANQLADTASLPDRRRKRASVAIDAEFGFSDEYADSRIYPSHPRRARPPSGLSSTLTLAPGWQIFRGGSKYSWDVSIDGADHVMPLVKGDADGTPADPLAEARGRGLGHWFVAGYGVNRNLPRPMSTHRSDATRSRLETLFGDGQVIGTGFMDVFANEPTKAIAYAKALKQTLLAHTELLPRISGLELRGMKGKATATTIVERHKFRFEVGGKPLAMPAIWLSQGYQSTIAWLADLVGQIMWEASGPVPPEKMEGLVLVDELDLHLHPVWQQTLIESLKHTFPRLQFVATTHSPLLLSGLDDDEIIRVTQDEDGNVVVMDTGENSPRIMTSSELYNTYFGVQRTHYEALLQEYALVAGDPKRSDRDEKRRLALLALLTRQGIEPAWKPVPRKQRR